MWFTEEQIIRIGEHTFGTMQDLAINALNSCRKMLWPTLDLDHISLFPQTTLSWIRCSQKKNNHISDRFLIKRISKITPTIKTLNFKVMSKWQKVGEQAGKVSKPQEFRRLDKLVIRFLLLFFNHLFKKLPFIFHWNPLQRENTPQRNAK